MLVRSPFGLEIMECRSVAHSDLGLNNFLESPEIKKNFSHVKLVMR